MRKDNSPAISLSVGFGNIVISAHIISIIHADSSTSKKLKDDAKGRGELVDATRGKKTKSILIMDSGHIVLSGLSVDVLVKRVETGDNSLAKEDEETAQEV